MGLLSHEMAGELVEKAFAATEEGGSVHFLFQGGEPTLADVYKRQVLGNMTETNFRRALLISDGSPKIVFSSVYCWIFIALIVVVIIGILRGKMKETKNEKVEQ